MKEVMFNVLRNLSVVMHPIISQLGHVGHRDAGVLRAEAKEQGFATKIYLQTTKTSLLKQPLKTTFLA